MSDKPTTAALMAEYLSRAGIDYIFGYPGEPNIEFIEAARRQGMKLILGRREGTNGFMAEAYGMLTGRPGVCLSTLGPGSTSMVNAVANAHLDRVPMIAISGQTSTGLEPYFTHQVADHNRLYSSITKWTVRMVPESVGAIMRKALRIATADRPGPVHITVPANVAGAAINDTEVRLPALVPAAQWAQVFRRDDAVSEPLTLLEQAKKPVLLTGISALRSGATKALFALVEKTGCPVVVSPMSKGVFPEDHPYYAGTLDMACNKIVWEFLAESDLLLAVGFDAVELITSWQLEVPAIHIDSTPNTDQIYDAEIEIVGHIPSILESLTDAYRGEPKRPESDVKKHRQTLLDGYYSGRVAGKLNPTDVVDAVCEAFPGNTIVTTDVGSHKLLVGQGWKAREPNSFLMTNGLSSMGFSLPASIAAKLVHKDRPVVCTVGDGGFAMVQGELRLAAANGLGIVVIVFCDDSLNRIEIKQMLRQYPSELTRIEPTDLVKLAESMECHGARVEDKNGLDNVLRQADGLDRPLVVEAKIDPAQYVAQF